MALITYNDKVTLNAQPSIANENKVTADDMNEIKNVVNTNIGEILYDSSTGSLLPITLSSAVENYSRIEIYASSTDTSSNYFAIERAIIFPSLKKRGRIITSSMGNAWFTMNLCTVEASSTTLSLVSETQFGGSNGAWSTIAAQTNPRVTRIFRVIGYK